MSVTCTCWLDTEFLVPESELSVSVLKQMGQKNPVVYATSRGAAWALQQPSDCDTISVVLPAVLLACQARCGVAIFTSGCAPSRTSSTSSSSSARSSPVSRSLAIWYSTSVSSRLSIGAVWQPQHTLGIPRQPATRAGTILQASATSQTDSWDTNLRCNPHHAVHAPAAPSTTGKFDPTECCHSKCCRWEPDVAASIYQSKPQNRELPSITNNSSAREASRSTRLYSSPQESPDHSLGLSNRTHQQECVRVSGRLLSVLWSCRSITCQFLCAKSTAAIDAPAEERCPRWTKRR